MLINEELVLDGEHIYSVKTYDAEPALQESARLREHENHNLLISESKIAAVVPPSLLYEWLQKSGVSPSDPAAEDVIKRQVLSGDYEKLRVWRGKY